MATVRSDSSYTTDDELLRQIVDGGNEDAFTSLVTRYLPLVYKICRESTNGDEVAARDLAQESVLVALNGLRTGTYRGGNPRAYLMGIVRNQAKRRWRDEGNRRIRESRIESSESTSEVIENSDSYRYATSIEEEELRDIVTSCLKEVSPESRELILKRYFDGGERSFEQLAKELGVPASTLKTRWSVKTKKELKSALRRRGIHDLKYVLQVIVGIPAPSRLKSAVLHVGKRWLRMHRNLRIAVRVAVSLLIPITTIMLYVSSSTVREKSIQAESALARIDITDSTSVQNRKTAASMPDQSSSPISINYQQVGKRTEKMALSGSDESVVRDPSHETVIQCVDSDKQPVKGVSVLLTKLPWEATKQFPTTPPDTIGYNSFNTLLPPVADSPDPLADLSLPMLILETDSNGTINLPRLESLEMGEGYWQAIAVLPGTSVGVWQQTQEKSPTTKALSLQMWPIRRRPVEVNVPENVSPTRVTVGVETIPTPTGMFVVTRWLAKEIANHPSKFSKFDLLAERNGTQLYFDGLPSDGVVTFHTDSPNLYVKNATETALGAVFTLESRSAPFPIKEGMKIHNQFVDEAFDEFWEEAVTTLPKDG